ncbi:hypothetical protein BJL95_17035 [Methylomonas sp. LWB]|uniref:tetratricopeptide repeat protein n=1 Tax=Methylomonas sp. LWB TaxID=1905845 RepID=UPI0008DADEDC|nr:tetratricopeptide repeat protein [Methylomonas sp. LWB]OHX34377.1 hypothetical protein BJL95_17035 [Methylomonas sp. LWB]
MSDNYDEETRPLFKLLRTEAFRFIIVRYNHFSLLQQLKQDLQSRFPERPFLSVNTAQTDYSQVSQSYFQLGSGFLLLEQFEDALKQQANPEQRPDIEQNNQRRRDLCAGLNLRRDKLAQYPITLVVCIQGADHELYAKSIMEKMPDLWSFRSYMLDLHKPIQPPTEAVVGREPTGFIDDIRVEAETPDFELKRLQSLLANAPEQEYDYRRSLYPQLVSLAIDSGAYAIADQALAEWRDIAIGEEQSQIHVCRGDLAEIAGDLVSARTEFEQALDVSRQLENRYQEGVAYQRLGDVCTALGDLPQALGYYQKYAELREQLHADYPSNVHFNNGLAIAYEKLGEIHAALGDLQLALEYYEKRRDLGEQLHAAYPSNVGFKNGLAIAYGKLGETHAALGDLQQALEYYQKYAELREQLHAAYPSNVGFKNGLAIAYEKLGQTHAALGDLQQALEYHRKETELFEQLYAAHPSNVGFKNGLAIAYEKLGQTHAALGDLPQALGYYEKRRDLGEQLYAAYPSNVGFKNGLAIAYSKLGQTHAALGDLQLALEYYQKDAELSEQLYAAYPSNVGFKNGLAIAYAKLAQFNRDQLNDPATAIDYFRRAEALWQALTRDAPRYAEFQKNLRQVGNDLRALT